MRELAWVGVGLLLLCCRSTPAAEEEQPLPGPRAESEGSECSACGAEGRTATPDSPSRKRVDPTTGTAVEAVGADLGGASLVAIDELSARPDAYVGKRVRLEGKVMAMCAHRRAWFALQDPSNPSGAQLRVLTVPAFLVPPGATGKRARTEGTVELLDVPAAAARHYSRDHRLRGPENPESAHRAVVLRASGAEYY